MLWLSRSDQALLKQLPKSPEELTQFYIEHAEPVFAYILDNAAADETVRYHWFNLNQSWIFDTITLKDGLGDKTEPVLVIKFVSSAICLNRVILVPYRTDWANEEIFDMLGFNVMSYEELCEFTRKHAGEIFYKDGRNYLHDML